jgi:hypothetical protein
VICKVGHGLALLGTHLKILCSGAVSQVGDLGACIWSVSPSSTLEITNILTQVYLHILLHFLAGDTHNSVDA